MVSDVKLMSVLYLEMGAKGKVSRNMGGLGGSLA